MTFYRSGRVRMTRAINRAMARSGNKQTNAEMIERMIQNSKNRFGGAIGRTVATSLASAIDSGVAFQTAEFLFFNDNEEDDGTYVTPLHLRRRTQRIVDVWSQPADETSAYPRRRGRSSLARLSMGSDTEQLISLATSS